MRKSISQIAINAFIASLSLFLFALAYPKLLAVFGLLFVTACIILGVSLIAALPRTPELIYNVIRKSDDTKKEGETCKYCGLTLPENATYCPNCGAPVRKILDS